MIKKLTGALLIIASLAVLTITVLHRDRYTTWLPLGAASGTTEEPEPAAAEPAAEPAGAADLETPAAE